MYVWNEMRVKTNLSPSCSLRAANLAACMRLLFLHVFVPVVGSDPDQEPVELFALILQKEAARRGFNLEKDGEHATNPSPPLQSLVTVLSFVFL